MVLSTARLTRSLRGCDGVTVGAVRPTKKLRAVYIDAREPRDVQDRVLFHELLVHGVLWESPLARSVADEERFAHAQSDRAWELLRQLGFRWPRRPVGIRTLERMSHTKLP